MTTRTSPRREIVAYLGIAYSLALTVALALPHSDINVLLSVLIPAVTVGILTFTVHKKGQRRNVWHTIGLAKGGFRVWPAAILLPCVLASATYGIALVMGAGRLDVHLADATPDWMFNLAFSLVVGNLFILGEEIGWRGYLLPRFQQLTDKRRAAVVTGFLHGCSHLPLIVLATTYDTGAPKWFAAPMAVAVITAGGVFYAWIWDRSKSVWPVTIAHNVVDTVFEIAAAGVLATAGWNIAYVAGETGFATLGVCVVTAIVLLERAKVWREPAADLPTQMPAATLTA